MTVFGPEARLKFPENAADVEEAARDHGLVVIDPLRGFCNGNSSGKVRAMLESLADVAARTQAAVLVVHHTNRSKSESPLDRILGSQDIVGIPRSVLFVEGPGEDGSCAIRQVKTNIAPSVEEVRFRIVDDRGIGKLEWLESDDHDEDEKSTDNDAPVDLSDLPPLDGRSLTRKESRRVAHRAAVEKTREKALANATHQVCWYKKFDERCNRLCPILPTGYPANVCVEHASAQTKKIWAASEEKYGKKLVMPPEPEPPPRSGVTSRGRTGRCKRTTAARATSKR